MSPEEIEIEKEIINNLTHEELCRIWRFAPPSHPYFRKELPLFKYFNERYKKMGGMTSEMSKRIGW
jgi:hypothetical protein